MYKGTDIVGKPIISYNDGKVIEKVKDVIFDSTKSRVLGLLVEEKGVFTKARILPFENIQAIGKDAVTILSESGVVEIDKHSDTSAIVATENVARGTKVMSEDGRDLGKITDIFFNEETGVLEGYEVSGGLFSDAYSGKSYLPSPSQFRIGEDVAFVSSDIAAMMEEQVGGVKGAIQSAGDKISELGQQAGQKIGQIEQTVQEGASVVGQRVKNTVYSDKGFILAAQGQIVTQALLEKAKQINKDKELYASTLSGQANNLKAQASDSLEKTGAGLGKGISQIKEKATQTWSHLKDKNATMLEERRINTALGRPVTRVILDQQDQPILNTGDLVTHEAINRAREEDALDILLDSIYTKEPNFSSDELKAAGV